MSRQTCCTSLASPPNINPSSKIPFPHLPSLTPGSHPCLLTRRSLAYGSRCRRQIGWLITVSHQHKRGRAARKSVSILSRSLPSRPVDHCLLALPLLPSYPHLLSHSPLLHPSYSASLPASCTSGDPSPSPFPHLLLLCALPPSHSIWLKPPRHPPFPSHHASALPVLRQSLLRRGPAA